MYERPKLIMRKTAADICFDILGSTIFVVSIVYMLFKWGDLPPEIPAHFNGAGEVDRYGGKGELFILPIMGFLTWIFLEPLERNPQIHNYPARINETNFLHFYRASRSLLNQLKNASLAFFGYISFQTVQIALGKSDSLGGWFLSVLAIVMLALMVTGFLRMKRIG